jgi:predicted transposase YbfD/YdcC
MQSTTVLAEIQLPETAASVEPRSLYQALQQVTDRRERRGRRYEAALVLTLLLLGKLARETSMSGIAEWVRLRGEWLREALDLERPTLPCANTYVYVCQRVDVAELNGQLAAYFASLQAGEARAEPGATEADRLAEAEHLLLDGKVMRGSRRDTETPQDATYLLSVYSTREQAVVRQVAVAGKGQERTAALALLPELDLAGCLVSADALHTQPAWCRQILAQGGDYLLKVKRNQRTLYHDIALLFSEAPSPWLPEASARTVDPGHGRLTVRTLRASSELNDYLAERWPGVAQVFQLERHTTHQGRTTREQVYGLTSLPAQVAPPAALLQWVRQYWQIENRLHRRRDVTLGEDGCTVCTGQVPQVLALVNSAVLSLMDWLGVDNVAAKMRYFNAHPQEALDLLTLPL